MTNCCSSAGCDSNHPRKRSCPACGHERSEVSTRTIAHHIKEPWAWVPSAEHHYFCDAPNCDVIYFGNDGSTIPKSQLRTRSESVLLCYCFGLTKADFARDPATKDFVVAQTKAGLCSCETSNPSGRCCLKDFPKP